MVDTKSDLPTGMQLTVMDPVFRETPAIYLDRLRDEDPVHHDLELNRLFLTRASDVAALLKDRSLSSDTRNAGPGTYGAMLGEFRSDGEERSMLMLDDPDHKRLRSLVTQAFNQRAIDAVKPRIVETATALLDAIDPDQPFDIIASYAGPLPTVVIAEMLGVDAADKDDFRRWSAGTDQSFNPVMTPEQREVIDEAVSALRKYLGRITEGRRQEPGDDLISGMIAAADQGTQLSTTEIVTMCQLLLVAGNVTTTDLIGNGVVALLQRPEELDKLRQNPDLIANTVEEVLRYDPPVVQTMRTAVEDREIAGVAVSKGDSLMPSLQAASLDPELNPDPQNFDVTRSRPTHFAFGGGAHFCLGAPLARAEAQIALPMLFERFPKLRLSDRSLERKIAPAFNGFGEIWVEA